MVDLAERTCRAVVAGELESALEAITRSAVDLGLCDTVGVVRRLVDGQLLAVGSADPIAGRLGQLQVDLGQGPAVDVLPPDRTLLLNPCLATDPRWPEWSRHARQAGIVGVVGIRLFAEDVNLGALTLYSAEERSYTHESLDELRVVAAHASIALGHFRGSENLWRAIDARHHIGQAQGILMERFTVSTETALEILRRYSRDQQMKLRQVAEHLVRTGTLPELVRPEGDSGREDDPDGIVTGRCD